LFHLGGLRRLDELGVLSKVDTIASVSGGSFLAAQIAGHLVENPGAWGRPGGRVAGFDKIERTTLDLVRRNVRTRAVLGRFVSPRNLLKHNPQVDVLAKELSVGPVGAPLTDVPAGPPRFVFCATDIVYRVLWTFDTGTGEMGDPRAGYAPLGDVTIARAAAASSCVPILFRAMRIDAPLRGGAGGCDPDNGPVEIVDGGYFDDLAVEAVVDDHRTLLISDGGPGFKPRPRMPSVVWRGLRPSISLMEQSCDVRKRWFLDRLARGDAGGSYWSVPSVAGDFDTKPTVQPYPDDLIRCWIYYVRDDLNVFTRGECSVLQNHGYLMADLAIHATAPELIANDVPPSVPFPEYMEVGKVKDALKDSDRSRIF
jgi:NTE family protein